MRKSGLYRQTADFLNKINYSIISFLESNDKFQYNNGRTTALNIHYLFEGAERREILTFEVVEES